MATVSKHVDVTSGVLEELMSVPNTLNIVVPPVECPPRVYKNKASSLTPQTKINIQPKARKRVRKEKGGKARKEKELGKEKEENVGKGTTTYKVNQKT